jgi:hypothetical protein
MVSQSDAKSRNEGDERPTQSPKQIAPRSRRRIEDELDERRHQVESRIESMVHSMNDAVELFHDEDEQMLARCMDYAAGQLESVAKYLKDRSFRTVRDDVASMARSHSVAFLGAALVGGLLVGRFVRSSARQDREVNHETEDSRSASSLPSNGPSASQRGAFPPVGVQDAPFARPSDFSSAAKGDFFDKGAQHREPTPQPNPPASGAYS